MKTLLMLLVSFVMVIAGNAQDPTGKWKLVEGWENAGGKKDDFLQRMYKKQPCLQKLVYVFLADGTISLEKNQRAAVDPDATPAFGTNWHLEKAKLVVGNDELDEYAFEAEVKTNKMTWKSIMNDSKQGEKTIHYVFEKG